MAVEHRFGLPEDPCSDVVIVLCCYSTKKAINQALFSNSMVEISGGWLKQRRETSAVGLKWYRMTFLTFGLLGTKGLCTVQKGFDLIVLRMSGHTQRWTTDGY